MPPGLNWSITDNQITISGTPTVNVGATSTNSYTYTVETIGASCTSVTETGVIDLVPNPLIQLIGGLNAQSVCEDEAIVDIVYNTIDGAENVDLTWTHNPMEFMVNLIRLPISLQFLEHLLDWWKIKYITTQYKLLIYQTIVFHQNCRFNIRTKRT